MGEIPTIDKIKARFAPDWVRIGEPLTDPIDLRVDHFSFRFLGEMPQEMMLPA